MIILSHLYHLYLHPPPISTLFPYTTLFRSQPLSVAFSVALNTAHQLIDARYLLIQKHLRIGARRADDNLLRRSEEHTSELQSRGHLVCRLMLEKKKT